MQINPRPHFPKVAVILAGGKGTRLGLTDRPKPLVPIDERSLLEIQLQWLAEQGLKKVFLLLNYMPEKIHEVVGDGSRWNLEIEYVTEDQPLGTSGALAQLQGKIKDDFFVVYGDLFSAYFDLQAMYEFHLQKQSDLTLLTHPNNHPYDSDLVEADEHNRVIHFLTKPHDANLQYMNLVNAAVYVFTPQALQALEPNKFQDLARDVFPKLLQTFKVFSYKSFEYVKDIGTPDRIEKLKKELFITRTPQRKALKEPKPCVFWDRDGTLVDFVPDLKRPDQLHVKSEIEKAIQLLNTLGILNVVVTNQPGVAKGYITWQDLNNIHKKLDTDLGAKRVWLDDWFICPHHPDRGFAGEVPELKINCECRKPKTGLFKQAQKAYNIDFSKSLVVGDSYRDRLAAEALGVDYVAILNGEDSVEKLRPNVFEAKSADELVEFFKDYFSKKGIVYDSK